jgi:MOSC domain-containing protein YiiM
MLYVTTEALLAGLDEIRRAPADGGRVAMIVRRPGQDEREVLSGGLLDRVQGLVGDNWHIRPSARTGDGSPHPDRQLTLMNARSAALVAGDPGRWPLAGDQLYIDLDLGVDNLPPGTRLELGSAVIEITDQPHRGCAKFAQRFGRDALRFVNSPEGCKLNLRGVNARVVVSGRISVGDVARKTGAS